MSEPNANPFDLLFEKIRQIVREEIAMAIPNEAGCATEKDALLTAQQAAALMGARLAGCIATIKTFRSHAVSIEKLFVSKRVV